jgi:hypothetical protein
MANSKLRREKTKKLKEEEETPGRADILMYSVEHKAS